MKITKHTLNTILTLTAPAPPETGGIIGGTKGIVEQCAFDSGSSASNGYDIYAPDTVHINQIIQCWADNGIEFYGIFHSHFLGGTELSIGDKHYIETIFHAMPPEIKSLYFPIILPEKQIIVYRADRQEQSIKIVRSKMEIL